MTGYELLGGMLIVVLGVALSVASTPVLRILPRQNQLVAQFGDTMMLWLARIFGALISVLGVVTLLHS